MCKELKYPWLVAIMRRNPDGFHGCGGTIIASRFVITAAHCTYEVKVLVHNGPRIVITEFRGRDMAVRIGEYNVAVYGETGLEKNINVLQIHRHDEWRQSLNQPFNRGGYDFAILELETDINLKVFPPACLAKETDGTTFDGKKVTVVGWGLMSEFPKPPDKKAKTPNELNITIEENCYFGGFTRAPNYFHMCAGRWSYLDGPEPDKYWYYRSTCTVS